MNLDFILFTPPKIKYKFMDLWGETIFIPKLVKKELKQQQSSFFSPFFNCVKNTTTTESSLTIDGSMLNAKGFLLQVEEAITQQQVSNEQEQIQKYIPCLYLDSMVKSQYLIIYFHASGEDIKLCHSMMNHLRNLYQINVLAMEYSGYSIYHGKTSSEIIKADADYIYQYFIKKIGFKQQNIIIVGRSIGTGVALNLMKTAKPRALALISSFSGIKSLAKEFAGKFGTLIAKETYDNISNIEEVNCPIFFLHGKKDSVVAYQNSIELAKYCKNKTCVKISQKMTHSAFDFYVDFSQPLRQFLMQDEINFYKQNMNGPVLSDQYFKLPQNFKI